MTAESITVSLEWAKKLKEAGLPQDGSHFYWLESKAKASLGYDVPDAIVKYHLFCVRSSLKTFAAPTAEEILRRLPYDCRLSYLHQEMGDTAYRVAKNEGHTTASDTLANAAAAMYCYLAENNLLPKQ